MTRTDTCAHEWKLAPVELQADHPRRARDSLKVWYCTNCDEVSLCAAYPSRAPRPELEIT